MTENSLRYNIQTIKVDESQNTTALESIVVSQDYDATTDKCKVLKSINEWIELPVAPSCKIVKFEADAGLLLREGLTGAEQQDVTFFLKKGTINNSFYVKNTTGDQIAIKWNTLGGE